ncbi:O-antigen ligase family protein [bacterium]|nr:O-antigen ligase family protein [bacterium]MDA7925681.1 O-antigen ligase family protein [Mariniblastus sp.]
MITPFLAQGNSLFSRLSNFAEVFPAWVLLLAMIFLLGSVQLAFSKNAFLLIPIYLVMCMFSGHTINQLDTGTTLFRWWLIFCFSATALKMGRYPGPICMMLGCYWLFSLFSVLWSPNFSGGIQLSGLNILMNIGGSCAIAGLILSPLEVKKTAELYCLMSIIFIFNGFVSIGSMSGSRFAGALGDSVGIFVITGGLLMPALLWAFICRSKGTRIAAGVGFTFVSLLCVLSGTRTGLFAGVLGSLSLLFQFDAKAFVRAMVALIITVIFCLSAVQLFPQQTDFISSRYFETDRSGNLSIRTNTTGRDELWKKAFDKTVERPVLGRGAAADKKARIGGFHNAYLQEWYNSGIVGVLLFFGASILALFKTFRLTQSKTLDKECLQISRLLFAWMIVLFLVSFFESKLTSPSNIMAFTMVLIGVMTYRLEIHANSIGHAPIHIQITDRTL